MKAIKWDTWEIEIVFITPFVVKKNKANNQDHFIHIYLQGYNPFQKEQLAFW